MMARKRSYAYCSECPRPLAKEQTINGKCIFCGRKIRLRSTSFRSYKLGNYPDSQPKLMVEIRKK